MVAGSTDTQPRGLRRHTTENIFRGREPFRDTILIFAVVEIIRRFNHILRLKS